MGDTTGTFDPVATAGLVAREVRTGSRDGVTTRIAVARRTYATDQTDLWDAVTTAERIGRWFLPVSGELAVGGRYQLEGNAGGKVERCAEPEHFAVTWEYGGGVSWLDVRLSPAAGGTTLELAHEAPEMPEFWAAYGPGAVGVGWDLGLMALGFYLANWAPIDPRKADDFATTPPGTAYVRAAAAGWAQAAVDDGDDLAAAREAAERTVVFYTVPPEPETEGTESDGAGPDGAGPDSAASDAAAHRE